MKYLSYLLPLLFCALSVSTAAAQQKCDADFEFTVKCNTVTFKPDSLKAGIKYAWDFGVAGITTDTSTQQMPTYIYFNADSVGTFTFPVRLILVDGSCIDTVIKTVTFTIGANDLPDASMLSLGVGQVLKAPFLHCKASPPPATFTLNVQNNSSSAGANALYQIAWGDSTKLDTLTPVQFGVAMHTYLRMGLFNINLIVTGKNGCVDSTYYKFFNGRNPAAGIGVPLNADLCVPSAIEFDYTTDMVNNPPGTVYTYTVDDGDGTPFIQEIAHQLPIKPFIYNFTHGSCEPGYTIGMKSPPEQFVVSMVASNLCGQDDALTTPSLSTNGTPRFEMPSDTCLGSLVTILNTSDSSYYWDSDNQMCVNDMFVYWEISGGPFNLVSGTLGNPMTFQPGTNKLEVRFTAPVVYTVKFTYTPGQASPCPPGILTKTICILPEPIATFTKTQSAICAPVDVTITNTSNTLTNCRAAKYDWGIDFLDSDCGDMGAFVLLNGTDTSSAIPPRIRFTKPGRYRIRLKVENECGMDEFEDIVNVADLATSVMEAIPDSVCGSLTVTPKAESTNACNGIAPCLRWTIPNPAGGAALIYNCPQSPPSLTYNTPGTYVITLETSSGSGCGTSVTTQVFTVLPLPALPTIAAPPVCEGSTLMMSIQNPNPKYEYVWSRTTPPFTGDKLNIPNANPNDHGGAYTVTITDVSTTLRCTSTLTVNAVVFSKPPLTTTGDSTLCAGQGTVLSVLQSGYQGYAWTQIQPASPSYILGNANGQSVNITAPPVGTYVFRVTVTSGATSPACTNTATVKVVVDPLPVIAPFILDTACVGTTIQLNATANHPGTGTWTTNPPVTTDGKFTSSTPGFKKVTFTFTDDNGCTAARTDSVCVQPAPVANFSLAYLPLSKCIVPGQPLRVTTTNLSNTLLPLPSCFGARYRWEVMFDSAECHAGPGAWSFAAGSSATSQAPVFNFSQSGRYTLKLTVTNACGTNTFMQQIEAGQSPQAPQIEPVPNACGDTLICLKAKAPGCNAANNETYTWTWNGPGLIASQLNPACITVPVGGPYSVTLTVTNVCGTAQASQTFRVEPPPAPPVLMSNPVCEGATLKLWVQNALPNHEYAWSRTTPLFKGDTLFIPNAQPGSGPSGNGGAYTVTVTDLSTTSKCTITQMVVAVVHPKPKVEIKGDTSLCVGESTTLTAEPTTYLGYAWAQVQPVPPPSYLVGSGSNVTVTAPPIGTYQFRVTVTDNSTNPQCTNTDLVTVVVNPLPVISIATPDTGCVGVPLLLTASANHPGTGEWTTTLPGFINPPNTYTSNVPGTNTATHIFTDNKGCKSAQSVQICTQPAPIANFSLAYLPLPKCLPLQVTPTNLSNTLPSCFGAKYRWEVVFDSADCHNGTGAWSFVSGKDTSQSPVFEFTQSGKYTLKLTVSNACGTNTFMQQVEVGQAPEIVAIDSIKNACTSALLNLSVQKKDCNSGVNFYQWGVDGVPVSTLPNPQNLPVVGIGVHTVTVTVGNACGTATAQTTFEIQAPIVPAVQLDTAFGCVPFSVSAANTTTGTIKNQVWTVSPSLGVTPPTSTLTNPTFKFDSVGIFTLKLTASNDACGDFSWQDTVKASAPPQVTLPKIGDTCLIAGTRFTPQPVYGVQTLLGQSALGFIDSTLWKITAPDGSVRTFTAAFPQDIPHGNPSGTYTVSLTVKNKCGTATATTTYRVLQPPTASAVLDKTFACLPASGQPVAITVSANTSAGDDLTYSWSVNPSNGVTINGPNTAQPTFDFTQIGFYTITLVADNTECSASTWTQVVKISTVPKVELAAIGDTCLIGGTTFIPVASYTVQGTTNPTFIDSYLWKFTAPNNAMTTSPLPIPPPQFYGIRGTHTVMVTVSNLCGTATDSTTYRVLQPPAASAVLDRTFACVPATINVSQNTSVGDDLIYSWSVSPSNGVTINGPNTAQPTFGFTQVGFYTITMIADNSECSPSTWVQVVKISDVPKVELAAIGDTCLIGGTTFIPVAGYTVQGLTDLTFIDNILWKYTSPTGVMTTSPLPVQPPQLHGIRGTHTVSVTATNLCGTAADTTTYRVLQPPAASAVLNKTVACVPATVNVSQNTSGGDELTYLWSVSPSNGVTINGPTTAQPTFNFAQVGFYTITMTADNSECSPSMWVQVVKISDVPKVELAAIGDTCLITGTKFTPQPAYGVQALLGQSALDFIDSTLWKIIAPNGSITTPTGPFPKDILHGNLSGTYTVMVTVKNGCGTATATTTYRVLQPPTASAVLDKNFVCAPGTVNVLQNTSKGDDLTYSWSVSPSNGVTINGPTTAQPTFNFTQVGFYTVTMVADNAECESNTFAHTVKVSAAPQVALAGVPDSLCEGSGLSITPLATYTVQNLVKDLAKPFIDMVNWSFVGSAGIQTSKDFIPGTIPYDKPGLFNISVSVSNLCGSSTAEQNLLIISPPSISATADITKGCVPLLVNLTNQPTFGAVKYEWDYGDGSPVEIGFSPSSHVYQQPGTFSLKVTVTDDFGCSRTGVVAVIEAQPTPKADFNVAQASPCGLPQVLTLKNTSVSAVGTTPSYSWTMLGASPAFSTATDPSVSYTAAGLYFIKLVARNQFGCSDSLTKPFTAYERPVPAFTTPDTSGCAPLRVRFDNNSLHWDYLRWEYDGVVDSTTFNPTYTFSTPGTYTVSLIVGNASGCEEKLVLPDLVKVRPTPIAAFTFAENFNAWPRTFDFTNTSVLSPSEVPTYTWVFGDGDSSALKDPSHRYFILEDQVATLLVSNQFGCFDTVSARVVLDSIGDLFIPNTLDPVNGEGEQKIFLPKGYGLDAYHIAIFTRTGQLVWESTELNSVGGPAESWDGQLRGVDLPGGVYVWKVFEARFSSGKNWSGMPDEKGVRRKTGFLELLR